MDLQDKGHDNLIISLKMPFSNKTKSGPLKCPIEEGLLPLSSIQASVSGQTPRKDAQPNHRMGDYFSHKFGHSPWGCSRTPLTNTENYTMCTFQNIYISMCILFISLTSL